MASVLPTTDSGAPRPGWQPDTVASATWRSRCPDHLRPVERRVLRWAEVGLDDAEIARRFGRSERWVAQVRFLADLDRSAPLDQPDMSDRSDTSDRPADRLRPLERRLLRWRRAGVRHEDLSGRFRRSPEFLARVEDYAKYKLAMN
jgi:hypothetical protein